jgi:glycosyltransferase involved in cell wall biosynthesis
MGTWAGSLRTLKRKNIRWRGEALLTIVDCSGAGVHSGRCLRDSVDRQTFRGFDVVQSDVSVPTGGIQESPPVQIQGKYVCLVEGNAALAPTFIEKAVFLLETYHLDAVYSAESALDGSRPPVVFRYLQRGPVADQIREMSAPGEAWHLPGLFLRRRTLNRALTNGRPRGHDRNGIAWLLAILVDVVKFRSEEPFVNIVSRRHNGRGRVLFTIPHAIIGGADSVLVQIAGHLRQLSYGVYVVVTMRVTEEQGDSSARYESVVDGFYNLPEFLESTEEYADFILYLLEAKGIDTIFQVGSEIVYKLLPSIKLRNPAIRVIDQLFNTIGHLENNRRFASSIDCTLAADETVKRVLVEEYSEEEKKVKVIVHGVDTRGEFDPVRYAAAKGGNPARAAGDFVVSFCGRISEEKGPDLFLEIARRLLRLSDIRFIMTGDGPLMPLIRARAAELGLGQRIQIPGFVEDVRACLFETDVVVVPSRIEGIPIILLEALSFGVPVVAASVGGIPSVVTEGFNGFLCASGDVDGFVEKIERLHSDRRLRDTIARNARAYALENLDVERMLAEYAAVFA